MGRIYLYRSWSRDLQRSIDLRKNVLEVRNPYKRLDIEESCVQFYEHKSGQFWIILFEL